MRNTALRLLTTLSVLVAALTITACSGSRPAFLGSVNQTLHPCPDTPNCVSSIQNEDKEHAIKAIQIKAPDVHKKLLSVLTSTPDAEVIVDSPTYVYVEFTSTLMRFVDDVEFLINEQAQAINIRSASRVGRSDFGVNRDRIEHIRTQLTATSE